MGLKFSKYCTKRLANSICQERCIVFTKHLAGSGAPEMVVLSAMRAIPVVAITGATAACRAMFQNRCSVIGLSNRWGELPECCL